MLPLLWSYHYDMITMSKYSSCKVSVRQIVIRLANNGCVYCASLLQELVNLLLCGRAHSNVFNGLHVIPGDKPGEDVTLRGLPAQGTV